VSGGDLVTTIILFLLFAVMVFGSAWIGAVMKEEVEREIVEERNA
jgi:hypothetical protein